MKVERETFGVSLIWLFGPIVWAAHFFLLYGLESFACGPSDAPRQEYVRLSSLALTVAALTAVAGFLVLRLRVMRITQDTATRDVQVFIWAMEKGLATLALIGILWTAVSAMMIPACTAAASDSGRFPPELSTGLLGRRGELERKHAI